MIIGKKTIYLGERKSFLDRLDRALDAEHAIVLEVDRQTVGSHQVTTWEVRLVDGTIVLEEDTFLGKITDRAKRPGRSNRIGGVWDQRRITGVTITNLLRI